MTISRPWIATIVAAVWTSAITWAQSNSVETPPNIVIVVSDDAGWADFGFNGCPDFKTPRLDCLAKEGTVFQNGYVTASVCSPSRAGLLTGRYQTRFGHEFNLPVARQDTTGLPLTEKTLADRLKAVGYDTAAFGKWHLGSGEGYWPADRGFDYSYIFLRGSRGYMPENKLTDNDRTMRLNGQPQQLKEYLTDSIARHAAKYILSKKDSSKPLFMYIAFNCPHSPLQAKPEYQQRFPKLKGARQVIAAMQTSMDEGTGSIVDALKTTGRWDNTVFWFINDNGGATYGQFNNGGLRGHKGTLFEGGVKVGWFVHMPKGTKQPARIDSPAISLDIARTSLSAAGIPAEQLKDLEGIDLLPCLTGNTTSLTKRPLFWRQSNKGSVLSDGWKLLLLSGKPDQLFHLTEDPNETTNLLKQHPDKAQQLAQLYRKWNRNNIPPAWRGGKIRKGSLTPKKATHKNRRKIVRA